MPPPPHSFDPGTYAAWHKKKFPGDDPLAEKVRELRERLSADSREPLKALAQILVYTATYCRQEYQESHKTETAYYVALRDALSGQEAQPYDALFKSTASIINKLWRKNSQGGSEVHLGNLSQHLTDLVRTSISATTLSSGRFLSQRMNALPAIIYEPNVRQEFEKWIEKIEFGPEMKMESGYFAYHGLVYFKTGLIVEVQIYSDLMDQWRKLSHLLYDQVRVAPIKQHEFDSKESRLISLGHLLHLAECQLQQLIEEFGH
jgi:ppGpp synthetase/RelA/SpoT-type nucleotidyltranferase